MPEAVIKVGSKKPPEPGKKRWKIISFQNEVFQVSSELAPLFAEGKCYKVFFENREFQGRHFKEIPGSPELVPDISTGGPTQPNTFSRPRTAKEDEDSINKRHRLNWIGERLDTFGVGKPTTYEVLRAVAGILEELYDTLSAGDKEAIPEEFPKETIRAHAETYRAKANAYKPGQPAAVDPDLDDDIPFN